MIQRKKFLVAGALAATMAVVAGCGGSSSGSSSATTAAPATTAGGSATTAAAGSATTAGGAGSGSGALNLPNLSGKSFTILGQWTGGEQAAFQSVINDFDKRTGASGQYTASSNETTVLGTDVNGGNPPDIAIVSLPGQIAQFAAAGKVKAQPAATISAVSSNFSSVWSGLGSYNGTLYGVPVDVSDKTTMWYNGSLFKNAGLPNPSTTLGKSWTWAQFLSDANTLASSGVTTPIAIGGGDGWTLTDWFENIYLQTAGVAKYNQLTKLQIPWTDPSVTTALTDLNNLWSNSTLVGSPATALKTPFTSSVDAVFKTNPTSGIVYEASFVATTITSDKDSAVVGQTALVAPFPTISGPGDGAVEAAGDFSLNFTSNPAALAFSQFLASPQAATDLVSAEGSGFMSPNKNLATSVYPDQTLKSLAQNIVDAGNNLVFDLSDQAPAGFGGTANQGEWLDLQNFLGSHNVAAAQQALQSDASKAYASSGG